MVLSYTTHSPSLAGILWVSQKAKEREWEREKKTAVKEEKTVWKVVSEIVHIQVSPIVQYWTLEFLLFHHCRLKSLVLHVAIHLSRPIFWLSR